VGLPGYLDRRDQDSKAHALVKQIQERYDEKKFLEANALSIKAVKAFPESIEVLQARERMVMWFFRLGGLDSDANDEEFARELGGQLSKGASRAQGKHLANLEAHLGWADSLRQRAGVGGLDPIQHYRRALELDPRNVFAHTMWGFEILSADRSAALDEAKKHFSAAVESPEEREYVRRVQISALLWNPWAPLVLKPHRRGITPERKNEAIRVVNEMRANGEPKPPPRNWDAGSIKRNMWNIYFFDADSLNPGFLAALPPEDHLHTFGWLFQKSDFPTTEESWVVVYLFVLAQLEERRGDPKRALMLYQSVRGEFERKRFDDPRIARIAGRAGEAIKRLSS
jgi:hypothetical protein